MEAQQEELSLPFSKPRQEAIIGHCLINDQFFSQASLRIQPSWFVDVRCSQVWQAMLDLGAKFHRRPSMAELKESKNFQLLEQKEREVLRTCVDKCLVRTSEHGLDSITPELTEWLHARIYAESLNKSYQLFNASKKFLDSAKKRTEAYQVVRDMLRKIDDISFEPGSEEKFEEIAVELQSIEKDMGEGLTFGIDAMDRLLLPESNGKGSLLKGDMTILLAPVNTGKTTCMITIAAANIKLGRNVLLVTHEGRPSDIKLKVIQAMTGLTKKEVFDLPKTQAGSELWTILQHELSKHFMYVPIHKASGLYVEEVFVRIEQALDEFYVRNGEPIDLIIDDYLAKLNTHQNDRGNLQRRHVDEIVYNYGVQLALAREAHMLSAIQTNREGFKQNQHRNNKNSDLLHLDVTMESWGPITAASNVISMNRDQYMKANDIIIFSLCKSRSSETDWAVVCKSRYATSLTHHNDFGATWYRGSASMGERTNEILTQYAGRAVPDLYFR